MNSNGKINGGVYSGDNNDASMRISLTNVVMQDYSFNMWVRITGANPMNNYLITAGQGLSGAPSAFFSTDSSLYFNDAKTGYKWSSDNWQMITLVNKAGIGSAYVNGDLVYTGSNSSALVGSGTLNFFGPWDNVKRSLNGVADNLGFWSRPLSINEVSKLFK